MKSKSCCKYKVLDWNFCASNLAVVYGVRKSTLRPKTNLIILYAFKLQEQERIVVEKILNMMYLKKRAK